jgi:hypothetical protein
VRHRLLIIAVFLLAGAVVNVAVAWLCWLGSDMPRRSSDTTLPIEETWKIGEDLGLDINPIFGRYTAVFRCGYGVTLDMVRFSNPSGRMAAIVSRVQAGWPAHTMRGYTVRVPNGPLEYRWAYSVREGKPAVPLLPTWPGLAVNSAFYAVILWLLMWGAFALRRFVRKKRGLCLECAYPRGESDMCTECGKALPGRRAVTA